MMSICCSSWLSTSFPTAIDGFNIAINGLGLTLWTIYTPLIQWSQVHNPHLIHRNGRGAPPVRSSLIQVRSVAPSVRNETAYARGSTPFSPFASTVGATVPDTTVVEAK
ncbi:hypothetical protein A2U01_0053758, partial [Trifolium medium]|nr:hypothetical protein [Trifolium medium]